MRQIVITKPGTKKVLQVQERDHPKPGKGEVLIQVKAAGVNFADILARKGIYPDAPKYPCVVGYEVSGVVTEVGEEVDPQLINKEVLAITRFCGYADMVVVPDIQVFEKPATLSFEEAAAIPVVYLTAYQLLVVMGSLQKGESILIHNAGGGVGLAALDIALHIGATTYGTSSPSKHGFLKERGLHHAIDYRNSDWTKVLKDLKKEGVELIIDPIGGRHFRKSYKALRSTGRLGVFGISAASGGIIDKLNLAKVGIQMPWFNPIFLMNHNRGVFGVNLGHLWHEKQKVNTWMQKILEGVIAGWVRPKVDSTFSFENAGEAHDYIEMRKNIGKVILVP